MLIQGNLVHWEGRVMWILFQQKNYDLHNMYCKVSLKYASISKSVFGIHRPIKGL